MRGVACEKVGLKGGDGVRRWLWEVLGPVENLVGPGGRLVGVGRVELEGLDIPEVRIWELTADPDWHRKGFQGTGREGRPRKEGSGGGVRM